MSPGYTGNSSDVVSYDYGTDDKSVVSNKLPCSMVILIHSLGGKQKFVVI